MYSHGRIISEEEEYEYTNKKEIWILFMKQDKVTKARTWNWLTELYSGSQYIHCELYFPDTRESVSVDSIRPVYFEVDKHYYPNNWDAYSLTVTQRQYDIIYGTCLNQIGKPFDKYARNWFICYNFCIDHEKLEDPERWFCSRLITFALM